MPTAARPGAGGPGPYRPPDRPSPRISGAPSDVSGDAARNDAAWAARVGAVRTANAPVMKATALVCPMLLGRLPAPAAECQRRFDFFRPASCNDNVKKMQLRLCNSFGNNYELARPAFRPHRGTHMSLFIHSQRRGARIGANFVMALVETDSLDRRLPRTPSETVGYPIVRVRNAVAARRRPSGRCRQKRLQPPGQRKFAPSWNAQRASVP